MRIFVTGGTGFIGSRVVAELRSRKHPVRVLHYCLANLKAIERELKRFKPHVVIHLAWEGLPDVGPAMSVKNLTQSIDLFKLLGNLSIQKVIGVGSCSEYEKDAPSHHRAFVIAKQTLKALGPELVGRKSVFIWAVPFFVYGAGKKQGSLIPSLLTQARKGKTPMPKNPNAWHDFIYVDDVARAIALLAQKKVPGGIYDIGTGKLTRTGEIATLVARIYGLPPLKLSRVRRVGLRAHARALRTIGWKPLVGVREGINKTIASL